MIRQMQMATEKAFVSGWMGPTQGCTKTTAITIAVRGESPEHPRCCKGHLHFPNSCQFMPAGHTIGEAKMSFPAFFIELKKLKPRALDASQHHFRHLSEMAKITTCCRWWKGVDTFSPRLRCELDITQHSEAELEPSRFLLLASKRFLPLKVRPGTGPPFACC